MERQWTGGRLAPDAVHERMHHPPSATVSTYGEGHNLGYRVCLV